MFDLTQKTADARPMQRAKGRAHVAYRDGRLTHLSQAGCAKVMLPRSHTPHPEGIFLNTSGGLTGGDHIALSGEVTGGTLCLTTQTAERAYASTGDAARLDIDLRVGAGATLLWLPQETILFDQSHLRRRTRIDAAPGARVLALEMLVFGRAAMGEELAQFRLHDRREVWAGRPLWVDALALDQDVLAAPAGLDGARAIATLAYLADDAEDMRRRLELPESLAASAWAGRLVIRGFASDLWPLKRQLAPLITQLSGVPLPRVWAV